MAEVNQDLVQQLEQNIASFEAAGPAFEEDVKLAKAKLDKVRGGKSTAKTTPKPTTRKTTRKKTAATKAAKES